jgi:hypothetical protein
MIVRACSGSTYRGRPVPAASATKDMAGRWASDGLVDIYVKCKPGSPATDRMEHLPEITLVSRRFTFARIDNQPEAIRLFR